MSYQKNNPYCGMQRMRGSNFPPESFLGMRALSESEMHARHLAQMTGAQNALAGSVEQKPLSFAARAAYYKRNAKTRKERKLADLMVFVAKYRGSKGGEVILFPEWLSMRGRDRLLEIAGRS